MGPVSVPVPWNDIHWEEGPLRHERHVRHIRQNAAVLLGGAMVVDACTA